MKRILIFFNNLFKKNKDFAKVELLPLKMELNKVYTYDEPHELSLFIPRVEIREKIETPFFTKTKETIYNSITIVDAPRAPLSEEGEKSK